MNIRLSSRIILLLVFASLLSITAFAQDEAELKLPIELKLTAQTTAFCVGSPLMLELEVTNNGQTDMTIIKSHLWKEFSFGYLGPNEGSRGGGMGRLTADVRGRLSVRPGGSYSDTFEFPLTSEFFGEAGHYTIKTNLDHFFSNDLTFELYDCGRPQKVEGQK